MRNVGQAIAVLVILLVLYVVSYLALLNPLTLVEGNSTRADYTRSVFFRDFGFSQDFLQVAYKPLISLDQRMRPEYWSSTEAVEFGKSSEP